MATCCICRRELDMFHFCMPFSSDHEKQMLCRDCYTEKLALDNSRAEEYIKSREYFTKHLKKGRVAAEMQPILEAYIKERDNQNEDVMLDYEIQQKFDAYVRGNGNIPGDAMKSFLITTSNSFEGYRIKRYITLVSGETALGTGSFSDWSIGISDMLGEEDSGMERKLMEAKRSAQRKMIRRAIGCDANAILGISFDVTTLANNMVVVSVNGTAVEVEKIEE